MSFWKSHRTLFLVALIAILLSALGGLQYQWVGELSAFEHRRMQNSLLAASERFEDDFDREIDRLWNVFRIRRSADFPEAITEEYEEWALSVPFPEVIETAYWVSAADEALVISRFNAKTGRFEPASWPLPFGRMRDEFRRELEERGRFRRDSYIEPVGQDRLGLVVAQRDLAVPSRAIVTLRRSVLEQRLIPTRLRDYLSGGGELDYDVWILDEADNGRVLYRSDQALGAGTNPDVRIKLKISDHIDVRHSGRHLWSVLLRHRAGSLEAAVAQIRRRNLAVSLGILALLGTSCFVLVAATRRAQSLADQQMAFVAGVSHELRTPITGISSLSQNLSDGVVRSLDQAQKYGEVIYRESRRLADMIETVLGFSATRSRNRRYDLRPIALAEVVDDAFDALGPTALERFRIERSIDDDLPAALADARAIRSVIQNLLSNAMKFSEEGGLIRLSARQATVDNQREIQLVVEDEGHGIAPAELPHIFEPFFRGRRARAEQVEGSGLGLSLVKEVVEAQGGGVTATSTAGAGSRFTLHLPVAEAQEERGDDAAEPAAE